MLKSFCQKLINHSNICTATQNLKINEIFDLIYIKVCCILSIVQIYLSIVIVNIIK